MIDKDFRVLREIKVPKIAKTFPRIVGSVILLIAVILSITPWIQNSKGFGYVMAIDPNDRTQTISATVEGRIKKWYVRDGAHVKKGEKLVEIVDNDPLILRRIEDEKNAQERKLEVATMASDTAKINYLRQEELFNEGLSSRKEFEKAKIEYKKLLSATESVKAEWAQVEIKFSRQASQVIRAPKDGSILKLLAGDSSTIVKVGDKLATFAPDLNEPAVELYVSGNDISLIYPGRKVRLQFEGWPAVQFSGWPEVAIGTFGGIVSSVDTAASENGKFRIIVIKDPEEKWPDGRFLRHAAKAYGWVLLNEVKLGYELWRQINNFPPEFDKQNKKELTK